METIFLVYKTDSWHSYASRDTIGVATSDVTAYAICKAQAEKEGESLDQDQRWNLQNLKQTQGYSGEGEFQFEEVQLNVLL